MTAAPRYDYAILGGGCAGLSLAVEMMERAVEGRTVILEPRTGYERDRTWCFWSTDPHRFETAVAHRWSRWQVRHGGRLHTHASRRYAYCEVPADAFYRGAVNRILRDPRFDLRLGCRAETLDEGPDGVAIGSNDGAVDASFVFDSRPRRDGPAPTLLQHFGGLRVRTESASFDPRTVTLMDFDVPQDDGIHFLYVLPYTEREALVESTLFSTTPLAPECYRDAVERYLHVRFDVRKFDVVGGEGGVIPMDARRIAARVSNRIRRIGTVAGRVKPSTGYAFLAIQRESQALARALAAPGGREAAVERDALTRRLDAIFLAVLRRHPERGPELLSRLFERVAPDSLVRFLSDRATPRDRLAVVGAMPTGLFLREAWRSRALWRNA